MSFCTETCPENGWNGCNYGCNPMNYTEEMIGFALSAR